MDEQWFHFSVVVCQTLIYIATLSRFLNILENKLSKILQNLGDGMLNTLLLLGMLWFLTGFLINYIFIVGGSDVLKLICTLFLILSVALSYKLFYSSVILNNTATELREQTKKDSLTKLKNRAGFLGDAQQMIGKNKQFSVVFMDLDNFKKINDQYGHCAGDTYLIKFANTMQNLFKDSGYFYRISGDEFIFLYEGQEVDEFCRSIECKLTFKCQNNVEFQGLSLGYASFPQEGNDLNTLMRIADFNMYQIKKEKHKKSI
ncbi:MAG: GGDEF domain-containing protein [Sedimentibacter sp.]